MTGHLHNQQGFSLMEVLVGAVVFMIGFGIVILMLNNTLVKLSTGELTAAKGLALEYMERAVAERDPLSVDTLIYQSGRAFRVQKTMVVNGNLAAVRLQISRPNQGRLLVDIYHEYSLPY